MEDDQQNSNYSSIQENLDTTVNAENNLSDTGNEKADFTYNASPNLSEEASRKNKGVGNKFKKYGPAGIVVSLVSFVGIFMGTIMTPALAIQHFSTMLENRFNTQEAFMQQRTNQMAIDKIKGNYGVLSSLEKKETDINTGSSETMINSKDPEILTSREERFVSMPEDMAVRVQDSGLNKDSTINMEEYYKNADYRRQIDSITLGAYGRSIDAATVHIKKFTGSYYAGFRSAMKISEVVMKAKDALKKSLDSSVANEIDPDTPKDINRPANLEGRQSSETKTQTVDGEKQEHVAGTKKSDIDELNQAASDDKNSGKSSRKKFPGQSVLKAARIIETILNFTDKACSIYEFMSSINAVLKTENLNQLIRFAITFINTANRIKEGTASEEEISYVGDKLLDLVVSDQGLMKTALESTSSIFSAQNVLPHDINDTTDPSVMKFQSGLSGEVGEAYANAKEFSGGTICTAIKSPVAKTARLLLTVGIAIGTIVTTLISGGAAAAIFGFLFSQGTTIISTFVQQQSMQAITDWTSREMSASMSKMKVSSDTTGEDVGNAVASGLGAHHSKISAQSGAGILSVDAAISYNIVNEKLLALKAEDERRNRSPFDASSPYTFLGNITSKMWPYWSRGANTVAKINTVFNVFGSSLSSLIAPKQVSALNAYATSKKAYTQCHDIDYIDLTTESGSKGAFDIFCNPIHGIPISALFTDSQALALNLDATSVLVAENGNTATSAEGFVGNHFTWQKINRFLLENNEEYHFFDEETGRINKGQDEKDKNTIKKKKKNKKKIDKNIEKYGSELWRYYKNCVNRRSIPFGGAFSIDEERMVYDKKGKYTGGKGANKDKDGAASRNSYLMSYFNTEKETDLLTDGRECILTNENLIESIDGDGRVTYTEMGRKVVYALFFADERAQCILEGDEECINLLEINGSDGDSGEGECVLPSDDEENTDEEDEDSDNSNSSEKVKLIEKENYALMIPENTSGSTAIVWLAGSGENGNSALKYGLPALAMRNGTKYPIIIPYKNGEYWHPSETGAIIKTAQQTLDNEHGIKATTLIGEGFSAGGQGIVNIQASGSAAFSTIKLYGSNTGTGNINILTRQLDSNYLTSLEFHIGKNDNNFRDRAKSDYEKLKDTANGNVTYKEYPGIGHDINDLYTAAGTGSLNCTIAPKDSGANSNCGDGEGKLNAKYKGGTDLDGWSNGRCPTNLPNSRSVCIWWEDKNKHVMYSDQNQKPSIRLKVGEYADLKVLVPTAQSSGCISKISIDRCQAEVGTKVSHGDVPSVNSTGSKCETAIRLSSPLTVNWSISGNKATSYEGVESSLITAIRIENEDSALRKAINSNELKVVPKIQVIVTPQSGNNSHPSTQTLN